MGANVRKERDEQGSGVEILEGCQRETTGIPGLTLVTMAGTTSRCTIIAPQFTMLARKSGVVCFTVAIQASPYSRRPSTRSNHALLSPISTRTPLSIHPQWYSHDSIPSINHPCPHCRD